MQEQLELGHGGRKGADHYVVYGTNWSWGTAGTEPGAHRDCAEVVVRARGRRRRAPEEEEEVEDVDMRTD